MSAQHNNYTLHITLTLVALHFTLYIAAYSADWRAFKRTPDRTSFACEQAYPKLEAKWYFETQGGIASSAGVYNGVVYFGSRNGGIYALNAFTGEELWDYSTGNWVDSSPCISSNGKVYVASKDGNLYCLDAISGSAGPLWQYQTGGSDTSSPIVAEDGKVYCATGHPQKYVYVCDAESGLLLDKYSTEKFIYSSPALKNNILYIGATGGKFYSLDAQTLSKDWENQTIGSIYFATMAISDDAVYGLPGDDDRTVHSFDIFSGVEKWKSVELSTWTTAAYVSSIALGDDDLDGKYDTLYVACGFKPVKLYAFNINNGDIKWETFIGDATIEGFLSSPAIANDIIYIGSGDGYLYAIGTSTGGIVARYYLGGPIVATPAISNGWVYIGTLEGKFWALQAERITSISKPEENTELRGVVDIKGFAINPEFQSYKVEYKKSAPGNTWQQIGDTQTSQVNGKKLISWNTTDVEEGNYQLRLTVNNSPSNRAITLYRVSQTISMVISAANGGTVIHSDGTEAVFPPGALNADDTVTIRKLSSGNYSEEGIDSNLRASSVVYEFILGNPTANTPFNKLVTIKMKYVPGSSGMAVNAREENLRAYFWSSDKNKWRLVNTSKPHSDENPKRVWADVSHFSIYRLMEFIPGGPLLEEDKVYTYPNPAKGNTLSFKFYLSDKADVEIDVYNIVGEKIGRLKQMDNPAGIVSEILWDISDIASGVYIYRVKAKSPTQEKAITKKLAIIK